jgi:hypothetical protein
MDLRLYLIGMVTAASAPMLAACGTEFVLTGGDASSSDGGTDVALYDEPLIVNLDATSTGREAGIETGADRSACDPTKSPHDDPCVIDDALGAFVAPAANGGSDTTGSGTKASPYATIGQAIASAAHRTRIYACDAIYTEQVTLFWTLSIYGGLSCPGSDAAAPWAYVGGRADVVSPSGDPAFTVNAVAPAISIEDMGFTASNASGQDATGNGKSSIAAFVKASAVDFRRCAFHAGSGDNGNDGTTGTNYAIGAAKTAPDGNPNDGGTGGAGGSITCSNGTSSTGGRGGDGSPDGGANGSAGSANPMPILSAPFDGRGGYGGASTCSQGDPGANGALGAAAPAAASYGKLMLGGWAPGGGGDGEAGGPGQGAGGGGGKATPPVGATGGGAGGCGGAGGSGGKGGGASIALACIASNVILDACTLTTANAGNGGKGGDGQTGQGGGTYGVVAVGPPAGPCGGGYYAGNGAGGGGGAGGTGGVSIDIVYQGTAPTGMRLYSTGNAGQPGAGGMGGAGGTSPIGRGVAGPNGPAGLAGLATSIWQMQ